ncbi:hypothetical protein SAMN05421824_1306 [Hyunsoonleella jejuensis]|uniref:Outer membrane protein beta-barrel domain-containing protein n=1 Tax=Hyunsoonleella jejuensis TaxID=419940 RepID=A0A1H9DQ66_9FLAO|nr:DUF6588 family protein [Hyunsoonleella jejuensis]SEQ15654.1 hypothetical protein SAMN05421824_1306 [Hyunsoonleella jejuensis]
MKKLTLFIALIFVTQVSKAQNDLDALLAAGVNNAERFANDYLMPGTNGLMHSMNANWFNTANAKPLGGFEISIIANASIIQDDHQSFQMNIADYNSDPDQDFTITFADPSSSKSVATALGENDPNIDIIITYDDPILGEQQETITLPSGIGSDTANLLPTAFLQGALGLSKGIEIKARFVPKIDTDEVDLSMYGAGLQLDFTKWLPADKLLPVAISGLVAYTHLDGSYDLTDSSGISGQNQRLENSTNTWLFQLIASTKLPIINFYGGLGYIKGKSESDLLGSYTVSSGPLFSETIVDPFSVSSEVSAVRGTVGTKLKLGFFRLNAEYHVSEFNAFSVGINFGFR